jgi:hypothetical protein
MVFAVQRICVPANEIGKELIVLFVSFSFLSLSLLLLFLASCMLLLTRSFNFLLLIINLLSILSFATTGTCPFGKAHVDVPLGDLDHDNAISPHNVIKIEGSTVYPYGTSESYPFMVDTANNVLTNTAHGYAECSNMGLCDRVRGECECLPGYEGAACHRASCPSLGVDKVNNRQNEEEVKFINQRGVLAGAGTVFEGKALKSVAYGICSGHGTCMTVEELADYDHGNVYDLWDKDTSMGCKCDPG